MAAAAVASHRDAGCARARVQSDTCAVAQKMTVIRVIILVLKKKPSLFPSPSLCPFLLPRARARDRDRPASGRGKLSASLPDHARTGRSELEIDAFSIEGFPWD